MRLLQQLDPLSDEPVLVLDLETTGREPEDDRIVSIGALLFPNGLYGERPHHRFHWFFDPDPVECKQEAYDVHGISRDFLKQHDKFDQFNEAVRHLHGLMFHYPVSGKSPIIVCHSWMFDVSFLRESFARVQFWFPEDKLRIYCTKTWAAESGKPHKLDEQAAEWGLPERGKYHSAIEDAWLTAQVAYRQGLADAQGAGLAQRHKISKAFSQDHRVPFRERIPIRGEEEPKSLEREMEEELSDATGRGLEAIASVIEERETTHGSFALNSAVTDDLMLCLENGEYWEKLTSRERVALFMVMHKLARFVSTDRNEENPDPDHLLDSIGYLQLAREERE